MHAHRCKFCAQRGENTVWVHGDCKQGNESAHKCPKCGNFEWEKWLVPVGKLPPKQVPNKVGIVSPIQVLTTQDALFMAIAFSCVLLFGIFILINLPTIISVTKETIVKAKK